MSKIVSYLMLDFKEEQNIFFCQPVSTPCLESKSDNLKFLIIYLEYPYKDTQRIPQAILSLMIRPYYGNITTIKFEEDNRTYKELTFHGGPQRDISKIAEAIEEILNFRMLELNEKNVDSFSPMTFSELRKENKALKEQLKDIDDLERQNLNLNKELAELKNKWYFKLAMLFP